MLPGRPISGGSVLNGQVHDAEDALALHFRMKIHFLGSHTITLPVIQASSTQKAEMPLSPGNKVTVCIMSDFVHTQEKIMNRKSQNFIVN
jgi:hypothetical protein